MPNPLREAFQDRTVLVTGHTGFKGSWLVMWLCELGARVTGYSLDPPTRPSNFEACHVAQRITDLRGDVRDFEALRRVLEQHRPEVVFHLAAQPLVLESYRQPRETFDVNAGGTANLLEAVRVTGSARAVVCITTDKVYEDREWLWGYREIDPLGGHDPYSASKAMAELAVSAYRRSFFPPERFREHGVALASARAGNVIGGGDWAPDRLVPDCMRALLAGAAVHLRNPGHVRPWQHVLEALSGYLWLAARMLGPDGACWAEAWNFGPLEPEVVTTERLVERALQMWGGGSYTVGDGQRATETACLRLNWDKAASRLGWRPVYTWEEALAATVAWFKAYHAQTCGGGSPDMYAVCAAQIQDHTQHARRLGIAWAEGE